MIRIRVIDNGFRVSGGVLISDLTDDQLRRRRHRLIDKGQGVYEVREPLDFKKGELVTVGKLDKAMSKKIEKLEDLNDTEVIEPPKEKANGRRKRR